MSDLSSSTFDISTIDATRFRVQIISYDSYNCSPTTFDKQTFTINGKPTEGPTFTSVPILRVFGKLQTGHTCLIHIHNVFPYLYIPYFGPKPGPNQLVSKLNDLKIEIELRIRQSYRRKRKREEEEDDDVDEENEGDTRSYLSDISLVKGVPFYNYSVGNAPFIRVSCLSHRYTVRLAKLLAEGQVFGHPIQSYESHVPYTFQFLLDYNCYSCDWINLSKLFWRSPLIQSDPFKFNKIKADSDLKRLFQAYNADGHLLDADSFPRMARTLVEVDTSGSWIMNRAELEERKIHETLFEPALPDERFITSARNLLADVNFQRKQHDIPADPNLRLFEQIDRHFDGEKWVEIDELKQLLEYCTEKSEDSFRKHYPGKRLDQSAVVPKYAWIDAFPTSFEWIESLQFEPDFQSSITTNGSVLESIWDDTEIVSESEIESDSEPELVPEPDTELPELEAQNMNSSLYDEKKAETSIDETFYTDLQIFQATQKSSMEIPTYPVSQLIIDPDSDFNLYSVMENVTPTEKVYSVKAKPPRYSSNEDFMDSFESEYGMLKIDYPDPFFSDRNNYDANPFLFAGKKFQPKCLDLEGLEPYSSKINIIDHRISKAQIVWAFSRNPPSFKEVSTWVQDHQPEMKSRLLESQIEPITQSKSSEVQPIQRRRTNYQKLIALTVEIHVNTRDSLEPDPEKDPICAIFWKFDKDNYPFALDIEDSGVFIVNDSSNVSWQNLTSVPVRVFDDEEAMVTGLVGLVELIDPDILSGYEVHASSWGYIIERFKKVYQNDISSRLSRVAFKQSNKFGDRWGYTHGSAMTITGRHMLNIWRRLRTEIRLGAYTLDNVAINVLHSRLPHFSHETLTRWFNDYRLAAALSYYLTRLNVETQIVGQLEIIERITEESRLMGIDFYSIITRGSQFKVESLLLRLAKTENYILVSPSKKQVFQMDALECIPLILEPQSSFYKSPLVILDFQSLYPSIMIAYNYCYSTLLGRLRGFDPDKYQKLGVTNHKLPKGILKVLDKYINLTPNGLMFVKPNVRKSLLARMLTELLDSRILVKDTMKKVGGNLHNQYHNRQLALKLIANVTYGYASATFSGRMPHSAVADAIVSSGRETLLRAIKEVESNAKWGAKVVYGDTDSLFIYLPGKSKDDAFRIGREMAEHITSINPAPIKLKFEKVYHPCILVSKKRYTGWMYEDEKQKEPVFDAKGIETVRRDGIPAQQKMVKKALVLLFKTSDLSQVKSYVMEQFHKIMKGHVNLQDFFFAKEVRLGTYKNEAYIPPGARVSMKEVSKDSRAEPQYKERVFYIVKKGFKGQKLRDRCVSPEEFLKTEGAELDWEYYIEKVLVPPLGRIFSLVGVDVKLWYDEMPKYISYGDTAFKKLNVRSLSCLACGSRADLKLCPECLKHPQKTWLTLLAKLKFQEMHLKDIYTVFDMCTKIGTHNGTLRLSDALQCDSKEWPLLYDRYKTERKLAKYKNGLDTLIN